MRFETKRLGKAFGGVRVLDAVDFAVEGGRCHAIVGANGAGKSTFIHVISGVFEAYDGQVCVDGREVRMTSPLAAKRHGIGCVRQEFDQALFADLSLLENVLLPLRAGLPRRLRRFPTDADWEEARRVLERVGLDVTRDDLRRPIRSFRPAFRQKVAIATVLAEGARLMIFDEPTSSLGRDDADNLLALIRRLKAEGIAVIYISHHLSEVVAIADEVSVFRSGRRVASFLGSEPDLVAKVVREMLDRDLERVYPERLPKTPGPALLQVRGVTVPAHLRSVDLEVRPGEVLGITGLVGAGKSSLMRLLAGLYRPVSGSLAWEGRPLVRYDVQEAIRRGVCLVPEDRRNQGLLIQESVAHNLTLPSLRMVRARGMVNRRLERSFAQAVAERVHLTGFRLDVSVGRLSGGNQQKVVLGKWLAKQPRVLLLDEPTKGIDVGAKMEIYRLLQDLAAKGVAVVVASSEPEEVLGVADRVAVMRAGQLTEVRPAAGWTLDEVLLYATGGVS
ncbi:MAG: sugar ABC transporter ATP-binding protein, partial [Alicyclobacillus sp.]|nr:sugar ABC transporter ATP-binding protein [Alicyclobacillus sp.]